MGNALTVKILREDKPTLTEEVDMSNSCNDVADDGNYCFQATLHSLLCYTISIKFEQSLIIRLVKRFFRPLTIHRALVLQALPVPL